MAGNRSTVAVQLCLFQGVAKDIVRFADTSLVDQAHALDTTADQSPARRSIRAVAVLDDLAHSLVIATEQIQPGQNGGSTGQNQIIGIVRYPLQFRSE
ncbi:hypothetical protein D3C86_1506180 [compost metagenome]